MILPVSLVGFPVRDTKVGEDVLLAVCGQRASCAHLGSALPHHVAVERVFRQAHELGLRQRAHGPVEMGRSGKVEQSAGELVVRHHDHVQAPMALPGARQPTHSHVLLLLAVLLVAHQVVCQKA